MTTNDIRVDPITIQEIGAIEKAAEGREIQTEEQEADATRMIQLIKQRIDKLEADRKLHTKPLNDRKRSIDKLFRPYTQRLLKVEKDLKMAVFRSLQARAEANQAALQAAQQAAQTGAPTVTQHLDSIDDRPLPPSTSMRRHWEYAITDPSQIPGHLWSPDPEKIKAELAKHTDFATPPHIPGLAITVGGSLTVRRTKG